HALERQEHCPGGPWQLQGQNRPVQADLQGSRARSRAQPQPHGRVHKRANQRKKFEGQSPRPKPEILVRHKLRARFLRLVIGTLGALVVAVVVLAVWVRPRLNRQETASPVPRTPASLSSESNSSEAVHSRIEGAIPQAFHATNPVTAQLLAQVADEAL